MMIPYAYNPALHDLYLYEDFTFTHSGGTSTVKRPYAFNPDSPLYGYRYSLEGIMACYRTFSSCVQFTGGWPAWALAANDLTLDVNKPARCNSWPPTLVVVHPKIAWACYHTFGFSGSQGFTRDTNLPFHSMSSIDSYVNKAHSFRWITGNNTIVDLTSSDLYHPYTHDTAEARDEQNAISFPLISDATIVEAAAVYPINPVAIVDPSSIPIGADIWCLDGSMKIIALKKVISGIHNFGFDVSSEYITTFQYVPTYAQYRVFVSMDCPDGSAYMHDSGSTFYHEISPPSSPAAGDGIMGIIPGVLTYQKQVMTNDMGDSAYEYILNGGTPLCSISPRGQSSPFTTWQNYWQGRSINLTLHAAQRAGGNLASETVAQQIRDYIL